ncbi:hypothetical protein ACLKA6_002846 [Drosophila palustris]
MIAATALKLGLFLFLYYTSDVSPPSLLAKSIAIAIALALRDACAPAMPLCGFAAFDFDVSDITNYAQEQSRAAAAKGPPSMSIGQGQIRRTQWQPRPDETMTSLDGAQ